MVTAIFYNSAWYIYNFRRNLIAELQNAGHKVVAISPVDEFVGKLEALGVVHYPLKMEPLNTNPLKELSGIFELFTLLRKIKPNFILSFTVKCNLYAGLCNLILPFKQIANVSGLGQVFDKNDLLNKIVCSLYRVALRKVTGIFFQNSEDLKLCLDRKLVPKDKCCLLPGSGVDLKFFMPISRPPSPKRKCRMFGRLLPKKGYDLYLAAAGILRERFGDQVEFQLMGVPDEKRAASLELYQQTQKAQAAGFITLIPKRSDVRPVLQSADVIVLPSTYNEGIPRSLLEALGCGKPVITTDWKGCRETVVDGINGYLIAVNDLDALVSALEKMIVCSYEQLERMGHESRALAENRFDERLVLSEYLRRIPRAA
jgi:glycosyltransferase involved in cell wall biosynthesis